MKTAIPWAAFALACLLVSACSRGQTGEDIIAAYSEADESVTEIAIVSGYNEPVAFEKGIGLRAVAHSQVLAISVRNNSPEAITLGPKSFRLVTPDGLYEFDPDHDDLKGFHVQDIEPGDSAIFTAGLAGKRDLVDLGVALNYPPSGVLMQVFVEAVD